VLKSAGVQDFVRIRSTSRCNSTKTIGLFTSTAVHHMWLEWSYSTMPKGKSTTKRGSSYPVLFVADQE